MVSDLCHSEGCGNPKARKKKYCAAHRPRVVRPSRPRHNPTFDQLLLRYVPDRQPGECWVWIGTKTRDGYGRVSYMGRTVSAHRIVYEQYCGSIPTGHVIRHSCDNPPCVNPRHLLAGTTLDNNHDAISRGRNAFGERNGQARLTDKKVIEARRMRADGHSSIDELASRYGVSPSSMLRAVTGKSWRHLPGAIEGPDGHAVGGRHPLSKLDAEKVACIRKMHDASSMSTSEIADMFGVSSKTITQVLLGITWKHVPMSEGDAP